ncbi:hypothetical protein [Stakelama marina]|uniref:Flagellar basal body-associated FliL family protein n=1 Tax=Stakelama marina TaxID=2826939 RepID=A0A8T4ID94_9SPHN|nr:hypothetical protein [Stakelama marina]MBR0550955.1 hypothetical protein [Stakelama marina]
MPSVKKLLVPLALLAGGIGVGGGAAYATTILLGPPPAAGAAGHEDAEPTTFVDVDNVLAPLVLPDGERLAGYVSFQLALEVPADRADDISARLPLLRHEINMRTYRQPMASGPDGTLPTLEVFRNVVRQAADAAFGKGAVSAIAIAQATPA